MHRVTQQRISYLLLLPVMVPVSKIFASVMLAVALFAMSYQPGLAQDAPPVEEPDPHLLRPSSLPIPPFAPGIVLVGVQGEVAAASATAPAWEGVEVLAVEPLELFTGGVSAAGSDGAAEPVTGYILTVPVGTEWSAIETLAARSDIAFAEPDWVVQIAQSKPEEAKIETPYVVLDPLYHDQWYLQRIGMSRAWALAEEISGGNLNPVNVVVIDTGVDYTHPDLAGKLTSGQNYINSALTAHDDNGHGTHIAGLIAAAANGAGMVGTGPHVELTPFKALNSNGAGYVTDIVRAIGDAVDMGADIINLSLEMRSDSTIMRQAIEYAAQNDVLVVAAAGNYGLLSVSYPAAYPSVLAVGATTYIDTRAYYSNQGTALDIVAPGGSSRRLVPAEDHSILSAWTRDANALCPRGLVEVNGGLYCEANGTSMATGIVSGVAALIMSLRPDLDSEEVREILLESAAPLDLSSTEVGKGRLDAAAAVRLAMEPRLIYAEEEATFTARSDGEAFRVALPLTNPSLEPLYIEVTPTVPSDWYSLVGPRTGEVRYGHPFEVQLLYTPTAAAPGTFYSTLRVTATTETGKRSIHFVSTSLKVSPATLGNSRLYFVWIGAGKSTFQWAEASFNGRTNYSISDDGSIIVDLPFTMTVNQRSYTDLRIFADGFVVADAAAFPARWPNECLDNQVWPPFAVYGWWSNLSLVEGSTLSTFQPDADRFVIEYNGFASMGSSDPDERVSFQIVLNRKGQIELNYGKVPKTVPANLTVGVSIEDGRFYNQITCRTEGSFRIGEVPHAHQSFYFQVWDLY